MHMTEKAVQILPILLFYYLSTIAQYYFIVCDPLTVNFPFII